MKLMIIGVALAGFAAFTPLSAQRPSGNQRGNTRQGCTNSQGSGSVSDIILGRRSASTVSCVDNRGRNSQVNGGGWYQVGNDGYGTIYERQTQDQYGNVIVQRARRDQYGNMSIISTRNVGNNGTYNNGGYNNGTYNNRRSGNGNGDNDDQGNYQNGGRHDNGNHYGQYKNKGNGKNKNKGKHGDD
jgi:hypothetical protein